MPMAKVIAMYGTPADTAAFDRYYFDKHVPLAKTIPGLRGYEVTRGPIATMNGPSPYYLIAMLTFDSLVAIQAALKSAEGQATAVDLSNFATGGVELFIAETATVYPLTPAAH
jgi:uncharacterized protein (TIGR02118 family)